MYLVKDLEKKARLIEGTTGSLHAAARSRF